MMHGVVATGSLSWCMMHGVVATGSLSWCMMHGVVATGSLLCKMHVNNDYVCPFCSCVVNLIHILNDCPRLLSLFKLIDSFIHNECEYMVKSQQMNCK